MSGSIKERNRSMRIDNRKNDDLYIYLDGYDFATGFYPELDDFMVESIRPGAYSRDEYAELLDNMDTLLRQEFREHPAFEDMLDVVNSYESFDELADRCPDKLTRSKNKSPMWKLL